ncbi:MAG: class I SAM-dependent methyltransferase [Actinomycetota bacterium]|nr:class I SAM-dependent methyltransferase [Actinomycetota bacterium]
MGDADRDRLKKTFDEDAALYDSIRPGYPDRLFDDLVEGAGLHPGTRVLEVGCGTGQATVPLAKRGLGVVCVEVGDALAAVARENLAAYPQVEVVTAPFEDWDPGGSSFDLVLAATSWHWIDPEVRCSRAAAALRPHGALAVISTHHVLPPGDGDGFFVDVQSAYSAIGEEDSPPPPAWSCSSDSPPDGIADDRDEIEAAGPFTDVTVTRYLWDRWYTADEYVALLDTYSGHRAMEPGARRWLYEEIRGRIQARPGGRVQKHYLFILHLARPVAPARR